MYLYLRTDMQPYQVVKSNSNMKKYLHYSLSLVLLALMTISGLSSCSGSDSGKAEEPYIKINRETVDFQSTAGSQNISISSNLDGLRATSNKPWCKVLVQGKTIRITLDESDELDVREATVTITAGNVTKTITVRQLGSEPTILVDKPIITVPASGGKLDFVITANVAFDIELPEWIKNPDGSRALQTVDYPKTFVAGAYAEDNPRTASIKITEKASSVTGGRTPKTVLVSVTQLGLSANTTSLPTNSKDIKVPVSTGSASSFQRNGGEIEKSFDGDFSTIYHSAWDNSPSNYFPITLQYNFASVQDVDYLIYHPRQTGSNGHIKEVEIFYTENGSTWTSLGTKDWGGTATAKTVHFDRTLKAKSFKFVVRSGHGDRVGFVSVSEMEFYKNNPDKFQPLTLFKNTICSELKDNVTEEEILACTDPFFRDLAYRMFHGKYNKEFRVAEFKAWTEPWKQVEIHKYKANPYSLLDNPTGMYVEENSELVVLVEDTHGSDLGLWLVNFDVPGGDGFNTRRLLPLQKGLNQIKVPQKGLLYVAYYKNTKEEANAARPVKLHFANGIVNGYYDSKKREHRGRWLELRNKAGKYFDLVGEFAHLTFPTENYKNVTPDGDKLIAVYDSIVKHEMLLHGLYKYNRVRTNRMFMHVMYHQFMYATYYHTGYNVSTANGVLNAEEVVKGGNMWGPAHEIGHMNQTRPGVLWTGLTECTVNIPSAYIQTTLYNQGCRVQVEEMNANQSHSRYTKAFNSIIVPQVPHAYNSPDVFCQLIPFWQLELYFGKVLGRTPMSENGLGGFYPEVYEYCRTHDSPGTMGEVQLEFAFIASKIAGVDLTEFFEAWGFFRPVDKDIDDYGSAKFVVTQDQINRVKQRIRDLNLPQPEAKIQYISDHSVHAYRSQAAIQTGTARIASGKDITLSGFRNVVVWEVRNSANELVYLSDGGIKDNPESWVLALPSGKWTDGSKLYAIDWKGNKTLVNVTQ